MDVKTMSELRNELSSVVKAAKNGVEVLVTCQGEEAVVLLSYEKYLELTGTNFVEDEWMKGKNIRRKAFFEEVKDGKASAASASMFNGVRDGVKIKVEHNEKAKY